MSQFRLYLQSVPHLSRAGSPEFEPGEAPWPQVPIHTVRDGRRIPLIIEGGCAISNGQRFDHCDAARKVGLPELSGPGRNLIEAPCVLVGSGPSAIAMLPEIRARYDRGEEIIAIKGAHDWLVNAGIVPTAAIALDGQRSRAKCFGRPRADVLYLCASQMHPDTWRHLRGQRVLIWHSRISVDQHRRPGWENVYLVPCASHTGTSAILLMFVLGRRTFELYGFDSSIPEPVNRLQRLMAKARGRLLKLDGSRVGPQHRVMQVAVGEQRFTTTVELVQQAVELGPLLQALPGIKVNAHGRGYFQSLLTEGKRLGWQV